MEETIDVVTSFLVNDKKILLVKRSEAVRTYPGQWAGISGYREDNPPVAQAKQEIFEETGLTEEVIELEARGKKIKVESNQQNHFWQIHPFKFRTKENPKIELNWENSEFRWCSQEKLRELETVPRLEEAWRSVADEG